jgi:hypothetical protein
MTFKNAQARALMFFLAGLLMASVGTLARQLSVAGQFNTLQRFNLYRPMNSRENSRKTSL